MLKEVRCGKCGRLLAKVGQLTELQIKCSRCGTLNHQKAESLPNRAPPSAGHGGHHGTTKEGART
ncbi:Com family DNA-binding transcriptional regulator [Pseudomonas sp. NY15435]|uniref:Com family DNA-binding transcriptional regulator n=1 Tax=Pseudomonas nitroreducens TaxID=46680 RepID=A0A5R8ZWN0_PSENT|nr:Com family DNA-binding transcriptional regulator [Pseudomonas nitroreducens]TLP70802.1 Com family DNA-binding transcriptional regulator [Pseudomonas nitroreducens]